jgi:hypothetical protein
MARESIAAMKVSQSTIIPIMACLACNGGGTGGDEGSAGSEGSAGTEGTESGDPEFPDEHPRIYLNEANRARLTGALDAGASVAVRFREMVDAQIAGADFWGFAAQDAAMLGVLTDDPGYCTYAISVVDEAVTAEEQRIAAGEYAQVASDSYLGVGGEIGSLALVYDWCYSALTADQRARWIAYANQAVWNVWHPEEASWGGNAYPWSGWSIDNPSNNYYYSFLRATMLLGLATLGENDQAQTWIDTFRANKIEDQLIPTFTADLQGGGSREGTGYGVAMNALFQLYDMWEATTGERIWDLTPHTRASLAYVLHYTVPTLDRIAPIGDHARDSTAALFDYHRAYLLALQSLVGPSDPLADIAQSYLDSCSVPEMANGFMYAVDFMYYDDAHASAPLESLHNAYHSPGTGHVFWRSAWTTDATWAAFIAGPYSESHAHRDQGSLLIYRNEWLAYDQNIESHSGLVQAEQAHNLVRIDDGGETVGMSWGQAELVALRDTPEFMYLAADITPIYAGAAVVSRLERELVIVESEETIVLFDRADTSGEAVWQLNADFMPTATASGFLIEGAADGLEILPIVPANPNTTIVDWLTDPDMYGGFRLDLRDPDGGTAPRFLIVLAPPGAVMSATPIDELDELGVDITFASGAAASVGFVRDAIGGALTLEGSGGESLYDGALEPGVDELPLLASP